MSKDEPGKVLKLALNSCYGKLAQTIGGAQYASRVWAGMITSGTRAQVLKLMLRHADLKNVLMIQIEDIASESEADQAVLLDMLVSAAQAIHPVMMMSLSYDHRMGMITRIQIDFVESKVRTESDS